MINRVKIDELFNFKFNLDIYYELLLYLINTIESFSHDQF